MKALPFIFILILRNALSQETSKIDGGNEVTPIAKEAHPTVDVWSKVALKKKLLKKKELLGKGKSYTAFGSVADTETQAPDIPQSPFFPLDHHVEQLPRLKKDLADVPPLSVRVRRSVKVGPSKPTSKSPIKRSNNKGKARKGKKKNVRNRTKNAKGQSIKRKGKSSNLRTKRASKQRQGSRPAQRKRKRSQLRSKRGKGRSNKGKKKPARKGELPRKKKVIHAANTRRLISGRDAFIEDFPYVVSIQKHNEHWCSGAILNPRIVVTTANCVWKSQSISHLRVRAGSRFVTEGGQLTKIQEVLKHPQWSIRSNPDCDLAMLLLDRDLRFSHKLHAADIPNRIMMPPFSDFWVTSWGADRRDGIYVNEEKTLQKYYSTLVDLVTCNNITRNFGVQVTENFICVSQFGRRAPCTRDTGAPAVSDGVVWGLASWGLRKACGTQRFPAMFSYLGSPANQDFIVNATSIFMSEFRREPFNDRFPRPDARMFIDQTNYTYNH